jgi:hypothetical protein
MQNSRYAETCYQKRYTDIKILRYKLGGQDRKQASLAIGLISWKQAASVSSQVRSVETNRLLQETAIRVIL